jgi:HAE1 family hydrophobic/amphiphilic exporter-1
MSPRSRDSESILPRFSLDRRITVLVLLATFIVVGVVASVGIPIELFPRGFTGSSLRVFVPWQDAPSREVMEKIAIPLEEELATVRGLDRITSVSGAGFSNVFVSFRQGTDMDVAYREVRDRVQRARSRMPEDADRVFIRKDDTSGIPVSMVGLGVDPDLANAYELIQNVVVMRLERIEGVAVVEVQGLEEKEILIELDRQRTEAAGLNIYAVAQDLGDDNFTLASGSVRAGGKKMLLRSVARYADLEAVADRLLAPSTRVRDVATVTYAEPEKRYAVRLNSRPAVALQITKEGQANTFEVSQRVAATVEAMKEDPRLKGLEMTVFFDQGSIIRESLDTMLGSGKVGALFAVGVLFFFLRRFRMTLIITLSIPLSLLIALSVMYFAGETLNILTLLGLMICVGLLVDNSVVVAENIFRLHRDGLSRRDAAIQGAGEIALAIVMATLTTVIVFLPAALIEGQAQFFLFRLAMPISVALLASLVVALVFVPLAVYLTLPTAGAAKAAAVPSAPQRAHARLNRFLSVVYDMTLGKVNRGYERVLAHFLRRRLDLVLLLLSCIAATSMIAASRWDHVKFVDNDENEQAFFEIGIEVPQNYTFEETRDYFLEVESVLAENQEALDLEGYFFMHRVNFGNLQGWFNNPQTTDLTTRQVTEKVLELLPERAGIEFFTGNQEQTGDEKKYEFRVVVNGEDPDQLEETVEDLSDILVQVEGVLGLKQSGQRQPNELALTIDRDRAQQQDINPQVIAGVVGYALRGQQLPELYADGQEIKVRVRFEEADRESLDELATFAIPTGSGSAMSLASLTKVEFTSAAKTVVRRDKRMARSIVLELEEGTDQETKERLEAMIAAVDLPEGLSFGSVRRPSQNDGLAGMLFAVNLSIIFIYLLMGFLFESFVLPLSIVLAIPLAFIGVLWAHLLAGKNIDFLGMVGMVLLIGVVVNNGIVLIDYVNRLRSAGHARSEAILMAARRRFRPIMMTAVTTICGMIPLTISPVSSIGLSYKSFGYTLIGGLTSATVLTMLVVPIAYTLFDDLSNAIRGAVRRSSPSKRATATTTNTVSAPATVEP